MNNSEAISLQKKAKTIIKKLGDTEAVQRYNQLIDELEETIESFERISSQLPNELKVIGEDGLYLPMEYCR